MTAGAAVAYRSPMRTTGEAAPREDRGLFGVVPPGRPTDLAVAGLVLVVQLGLTTAAARRQPDRQPLDLLAYLLLAARQRRQDAERTRAEEARRRAGEERMRIARELHDVLAHNISLINVQAGVALRLMDEQPVQARTALAAIKDASKDALRELRSVLGVLRQIDDEAPLAPAPGL